MLCVDPSVLRVDPDNVQKDIDLEDIINNHTRQFPTEQDALSAHYLPLCFSVSVRSLYDNTIVCRKVGGTKRYSTFMKNIGNFPHKGYDLIMYLNSMAILSMCEFSHELENVMVHHSQCQPIGIFNNDPDTCFPMVYSHVILSDEGMKLFAQCLKPEYLIEPISSMEGEGNYKALLDTIFEIKKEETT